MRTVDVSSIIVGYNFVIGILLMLSSQKVAVFAGNVSKTHRQQIVRLTHVSTLAFGASIAVLSAAIYVLFHALRIGV